MFTVLDVPLVSLYALQFILGTKILEDQSYMYIFIQTLYNPRKRVKSFAALSMQSKWSHST